MIEKHEHICRVSFPDYPVLTLVLMDTERYETDSDNPSNRIYCLLCLDCGLEITKYVTDNTISAVKELRGQMDTLYGKSIVLPIGV